MLLTQDHATPLRRHIRTLTSLRLFAAVAIVIGHVRGNFSIPMAWNADFPHYLGVSFFFVLSGFILCLSYPSFADRRGQARYLLARFARIWPLHAVTFLLFCLMSIATVEGYAARLAQPGILGMAVLNLLLLQAWVPYGDAALSFNAVSWSISAEAFFYVAFLWLTGVHRARWPVLLVAGLVPAVVLMVVAQAAALPRYAPDMTTVSKDMLLYINPAARLFEFTIGMAAARLFGRNGGYAPGFAVGTGLEVLAVALAAFAMLVMTHSAFATGPLARVLPDALNLWLERCGAAPVFAAVIFIFAMERGWISRLLQHRLLVLGGEISFAIYMTHLVCMYAVDRMVDAAPAVQLLLFACGMLALSFLCWRYVEMPLRDRIVRLAGQPPSQPRQGNPSSGLSPRPAGAPPARAQPPGLSDDPIYGREARKTD